MGPFRNINDSDIDVIDRACGMTTVRNSVESKMVVRDATKTLFHLSNTK